jgi:hypothetical protein
VPIEIGRPPPSHGFHSKKFRSRIFPSVESPGFGR